MKIGERGKWMGVELLVEERVAGLATRDLSLSLSLSLKLLLSLSCRKQHDPREQTSGY